MREQYQSITTKVSASTYYRFIEACEAMRITTYEVLQNFVNTMVKWTDGWTTSPDMMKLIHVFESLQGWKNSFSLADPDSTPKVGSAIYFLCDKYGKHKGIQAMLVEEPWMGEPKSTMNIQLMTDYFFNAAFPQLYKRLRLLAVELETNSIIETLEEVVSRCENAEDDRTISEIFSDLRAENGRGFDSPRYKRTHEMHNHWEEQLLEFSQTDDTVTRHDIEEQEITDEIHDEILREFNEYAGDE